MVKSRFTSAIAFAGLFWATAVSCSGSVSKGGVATEPLPPVNVVVVPDPPLTPDPSRGKWYFIHVNQEVRFRAYANGIDVSDKITWQQGPSSPGAPIGTLMPDGSFRAPSQVCQMRIDALDKPGDDREYTGLAFLDVIP